jgi:hypothetical protein
VTQSLFLQHGRKGVVTETVALAVLVFLPSNLQILLEDVLDLLYRSTYFLYALEVKYRTWCHFTPALFESQNPLLMEVCGELR